ncbi:MAG: FAD binding domain-containing protein [Rhodospirillales bacterium]
MKPFAFDYEKPATIAAALALLGEAGDDAKVLAGGQSLGPMMNMRLARPRQLVDITGIPELRQVTDDGDAVVFGACVTHATIEDGRIPDPTGGMMPDVAGGIAYRAVRNRGTIGGSLVHADPAADWITTLAAIGAEVTVTGNGGQRQIAVDKLMMSTFETSLAAGELLVSIRVPKFSSDARWGYYKFCRKTGEFAEAMSAIIVDPARGKTRVAIGAIDTRPVVIADAATLVSNPESITTVIEENGLANDPYDAQVRRVSLWRAIEQVLP